MAFLTFNDIPSLVCGYLTVFGYVDVISLSAVGQSSRWIHYKVLLPRAVGSDLPNSVSGGMDTVSSGM